MPVVATSSHRLIFSLFSLFLSCLCMRIKWLANEHISFPHSLPLSSLSRSLLSRRERFLSSPLMRASRSIVCSGRMESELIFNDATNDLEKERENASREKGGKQLFCAQRRRQMQRESEGSRQVDWEADHKAEREREREEARERECSSQKALPPFSRSYFPCCFPVRRRYSRQRVLASASLQSPVHLLDVQ